MTTLFCAAAAYNVESGQKHLSAPLACASGASFQNLPCLGTFYLNFDPSLRFSLFPEMVSFSLTTTPRAHKTSREKFLLTNFATQGTELAGRAPARPALQKFSMFGKIFLEFRGWRLEDVLPEMITHAASLLCQTLRTKTFATTTLLLLTNAEHNAAT